MPDAPVEVKIKGVRQLQAGAARLFANIDRAVDQDAVRVTAEQTVATFRPRVPRRTGRLQGSARALMRGSVGQATLGAGVDYARYVVFKGGRDRFVYPTAKRTERAFRKHAQDVAEREIRSMSWPTPL